MWLGIEKLFRSCLKRSIWDFAPGDLMVRPHSQALPSALAHCPSAAASSSSTAYKLCSLSNG